MVFIKSSCRKQEKKQCLEISHQKLIQFTAFFLQSPSLVTTFLEILIEHNLKCNKHVEESMGKDWGQMFLWELILKLWTLELYWQHIISWFTLNNWVKIWGYENTRTDLIFKHQNFAEPLVTHTFYTIESLRSLQFISRSVLFVRNISHLFQTYVTDHSYNLRTHNNKTILVYNGAHGSSIH